MTTIDDAIALANVLSGSTLLPQHIRNKSDIVAIVLAGGEMGLGPMASLEKIRIVSGRVSLDASAQLALVKRAGIKHTWVDDGEQRVKATIRLERTGDSPHEHTFSALEAKAAGLLKNQTWQKYMPAMLRARCVSAAIRAYCPDVFGGAQPYTPEELGEPDRPEPRSGMEALALEALDGPERERAEKAMDADKALLRDSEATLLVWEPMIEGLDDEDKLHMWLHYHGAALRGLHRKTKAKAWRRLLKAAKSVGWEITGEGAARACETLANAIAEAPVIEEEPEPEEATVAASIAAGVFGEDAIVVQDPARETEDE